MLKETAVALINPAPSRKLESANWNISTAQMIYGIIQRYSKIQYVLMAQKKTIETIEKETAL